MTNDLHERFAAAASAMPEVDLAEVAWTRAYAAHRRRRRAAVGAAAGVAVVAAGSVALSGGGGARHTNAPAASSSSVTRSSNSASTTGSITGDAPVTVLPAPSKMGALSWVDRTALTSEVLTVLAARPEWDVVKLSRPLSQAGGFTEGERIVAAYADRERRGVGVVTSAGRVLGLDGLDLTDTTDGGNASFHLSAQAISADGRYLVIAQPNGLVIVDATRSGAEPWKRVAIDDPLLESANLVSDGNVVLVTSGVTGTHVIDMASGREVKVIRSVWDAQDVVLGATADAGQSSQLTVRRWNPRALDFTPAEVVLGVKAGVWGLGGSTVSGGGWVAGLASPTADLDAQGFYQGVVAAQVPSGPYRWLLDGGGVTGDDIRSKGGVLPLGMTDRVALIWAGGGYESVGLEMVMTRADLLAWDLSSGAVSRLTTLTGDQVQLVVAPL
jgi:hypothetical protein